MIARNEAMERISRGLERNPVVGLIGPRQCGKTTLARNFSLPSARNYFDLEETDDRLRLENPKMALERLEGLVVIDEVQHRPELFPLLRVLVDEPGNKRRFLVLGSASPAMLRQSSETLAGRIEYVELGGFQLGELGGGEWEKLWNRGGFPRSYLAATEADSLAWRREFIKTFLERDIPQFGIRIPSVTLERFWMMLAHRHGSVLNSSDIARSFGVSDHSVKRYIDILSETYMVRQLQPWHENVSKRQVKSPKIYLRDSGILHRLLSISDVADLRGHPSLGASWEGFALEHVWRVFQDSPHYFWATHSGAELDLLVWHGGEKFGFEFKYADAPRITRSMRSAINDLALQKLFIVYPGAVTQDLDDRIRLASFPDLVLRHGKNILEG